MGGHFQGGLAKALDSGVSMFLVPRLCACLGRIFEQADVKIMISGIPQVKSCGIATHEVQHFAELGWFGLASCTGAPSSQS